MALHAQIYPIKKALEVGRRKTEAMLIFFKTSAIN
jgi:hypothetical protein